MADDDMRLAEAFQLTPMLSNLLGLLMGRATVTNAMLRRLTPKPKAAVFRLRKHIPGIEIHSRRYVGYWIEDGDKVRVRKAVAAKLGDTQ